MNLKDVKLYFYHQNQRPIELDHSKGHFWVALNYLQGKDIEMVSHSHASIVVNCPMNCNCRFLCLK